MTFEEKQIALGLCVKCNEKAIEGVTRCEKHRDYFNEYNRNRRVSLSQMGLCIRCGKPNNNKNKRCNECTIIQRSANKRSRDRLKKQIFDHYGNSCKCCGESREIFLCIDHIHGGGSAHVREIGKRKLYQWLIRKGFPEGFQILCYNCNFAKSNGGCPHIKEQQELIKKLSAISLDY